MNKTPNNPHALYVGQTLYYVPYERRYSIKEQSVTVEKIGRKWVEISPHWVGRIDIQTLAVDGGAYMSPGRCWLSEDLYKQHVEANDAWSRLKNKIWATSRPSTVSLAEIQAAAALLGVGE